ncbi:glycosyltransferase family 92-domain-containing protein [Hyaloraphidium curvatum]|nr:glycosyltransferase family 92-domain-containing protein [Hyaloraphidium curvatum]
MPPLERVGGLFLIAGLATFVMWNGVPAPGTPACADGPAGRVFECADRGGRNACYVGEHLAFYAPLDRTFGTEGHALDFVLEERGPDAKAGGDAGSRTETPAELSLIVIQRHLRGNSDGWPWAKWRCRFTGPGGGETTPGTAGYGHNLNACPVPPKLAAKLRARTVPHLTVDLLAADSEAPLDTNLTAIPVPLLPSRPRRRLAVHTMVRDVAAQLAEWIEYHRLLGFDHFYLYDNGSRDNPASILRFYMERGLATLVAWPFSSHPGTHWNKIQGSSISHALYFFGPSTEWLAGFDVDEYFEPNRTGRFFPRKPPRADIPTALDFSFPERGPFRGGLQVAVWHASCDPPEQRALLDRKRYTLPELCRRVLPGGVPKMFVRPRHVRAIVSPHELSFGERFGGVDMPEFGRIRHYHYPKGGEVDGSMDEYVGPLREALDAARGEGAAGF